MFNSITLADGGRTTDPTWVWSGDTLMDLNKYQALKMKPKTIGGDDYLFIEAGGFSERHPAGWQPPWFVLKRQSN